MVSCSLLPFLNFPGRSLRLPAIDVSKIVYDVAGNWGGMGVGLNGTSALGLLILVTAAFPATCGDLTPDGLLVVHTLLANRKLLNQLSQYTCLETIDRSRPTTKRHKPQKQDVVQLDVGVGAHQEIYSWPGDSSFSSKDLFSLVGHGLLANGLFESFAANLFIGDVGYVKAAGENVIDGKKAFHFTFTVPLLLQSRWEVNWLGARGWVGEEGEFWVNESDLTLLRLDVTATDIPLNVPLQSLTITIHYRLLSSDTGQVLIPETAALTAMESNEMLHREAIDFSHCRAFEAESNLSATTPEPDDLTKVIGRYEAEREIMPGGLVLGVSLETPVHANSTVVGDRVIAVLDAAVKTPMRETIPKGATLNGRVREFEKLEDPPNTFMVGLEFDELIWPGHTASFFASLLSLQSTPGVMPFLSSGREIRSGFGAFQGNQGVIKYTSPIAIPGVASFFLQGAGATLPKGFRTLWRTEDVAPH
jgi:hypothetical protein